MTDRDVPLILTIDDEKAIRESFRFFLEDYDFQVIEAENGRVGLELFEREDPDLILVDLRMPEVSGLEVLKNVTEKSPETPIIVISGTGVLGDAVEALHLGAWDYLLKPVGDLSVLLHSVEKSLERARLRRENREYQAHLEQEVDKRTQELKASEKKFRTLAETSPVAIMMYQDGKWIYTNSAAEEITGYSSRELQSMNFLDFVHPDFVERFRENEQGRMKGESTLRRYEFKIIKKSSEERWVEISGGLTDHFGKPAGIITVIDITEIKQAAEDLETTNIALEKRVKERTRDLEKANEELKKAKETADSAAQAKSDFLANMSHEIRTPMNGVIGATELAMGEEMSPKLSHYLKIIHNSGYNLLGIINDILDFSKIEAGKLDLDESPFRLEDVLFNVASVFSNKMVEKQIEMIIDVPTDLPSTVLGDSLRIQQILTNLIGNSFKFTDNYGIIMIRVSGKPLTGSRKIEFTLEVKDTGVGMTPEQLSRLFQPFTQADTSTTRKYGGTGLGLTICKQLVELMNGRIWVESEKNKGSTFYFTLPMEVKAESVKKLQEIPEIIRGGQILVVDDCEETRFLLRKILNSFGFSVILAEGGEEALALLDKLREGEDSGLPSLMIIDWKMPGMDGLETLRLIRDEKGLDFPAIFMSAFGCETELKKGDRERINGFLGKPFHASGLFDAIVDVYRVAGNGKKIGLQKNGAGIKRRMRVEGMKILLVEDNLTNQEIAIAVLEGAGAVVTVAVNGIEAVKAVEKQSFDAVLMDIQMPEMDGYEATRIIRKDSRFSDLPIVAMTANAMKGDEEKCLAAGMDGYITKPVNHERLFRILRGHVKQGTMEGQPMPLVEHASNEMILPDHLPGIFIRETISALSIDEASYLKIIKGFSRNHDWYYKAMVTAHRSENWGGLREMAHSLKGSSGNIGARDLLESSSKLEIAALSALDSGGKEKVPLSLVEEVGIYLSDVLESISRLSEAVTPSSVDHGQEPSSPEDLSEKFKALSLALEESDPDEIEKAMEGLKTLPYTEQVNKIEGLIGNYDFDEALELLKSMARELKVEL